MTHRVAVLAFDGVVLGDLAIPVEMFGQRHGPASSRYEVVVCSASPEVNSEHVALRPARRLRSVAGVDTLIVPGHFDVSTPPPPQLLRVLQRAHARGTRIASICTGAFLLAAAGLLDGRRATTHWAAAGRLAAAYPNVEVDPDVLYVDEGDILTSAGATAGTDLCLHMIRRDYGAEVAAEMARLAVVPLERVGGQSQYVSFASASPQDSSLTPLLEWLENNLERELDNVAIAKKAGMSQRSLARHFRSQVGMSPARWVRTARVRRAQRLLESTAAPVDQVAAAAGFASAITFRQAFADIVGTSPTAWRASFRSD